jgi:hypothetical protein
MNQQPVSFRLDDETVALLAALVQQLGIGRVQVIKLALRILAKTKVGLKGGRT